MAEQDPSPAHPNPFVTGLGGRCPRCGNGPLFHGLLSLRPECSKCGLDFRFADSGDGPAVFVILIIGFVIVGLALWVEVNFAPALVVHLLLWIPLALLLCPLALRLAKGVLINLQFANRAAHGKLDGKP